MIWNVIQEDFFSAFYYTRNESGEAMISCIKIIDICNAPYGSVKEFSLSRSSSLFIDRYFAKIYAQRENYFRYLESIKMTLGWKCKYSWISEFSDQMVPILLQRKICIEMIS